MQTELVKAALHSAHPALGVEHVVIQTTGDLRPDLRLGGATPGIDKAVWVRELEAALATGQIHAAVHSAKDIPADRPQGFRLAACLARADAFDVLISKHRSGLGGLPASAAVATSSVRRQRQLLRLRPDLRVIEMRGNVPTRLRKLAADSSLDALVLAKAGLDRLEVAADEFHLTTLESPEFLPAAGQGIIALEVFGDDPGRDAILAAINHEDTWITLTAERELLRMLGAGCSTPIALHTCREGGLRHLHVRLFDEQDATMPPAEARSSGAVDDPHGLAAEAARQLKLPIARDA